MSGLKLLGGSELIHDSLATHSPIHSRSTTPIPTPSLRHPRDPDSSSFSYNFINEDFLDRNPADNNYTYTPSSAAATARGFRNLTSTPTNSAYALSLPKSLPIDWDLFNEQYRLQQKLQRFRARKRRRLELSKAQQVSAGTVSDVPNKLIDDLPYEVMHLIFQCVDDQSDLINLSQTCKKFNAFVNQRLYDKIVIVDSFEGSSKDNGMKESEGFTVLNMKNYPKFLATLHSSEAHIQLIKKIVITTSTPDWVNENENVYQALYDIFLTRDNNLKTFQNYDQKNLKKFGSLLNYNKDHLVRYNFQKYKFTNLIEDEDDDCEGVNVDALIEQDLLNLKNAVVLGLNELKVLPKSVEELVIFIENQYTVSKEKFHMTFRIFNKFANLKSLHLTNTLSLQQFISEFQTCVDKPWFKKLQLQTLSITNIHKSVLTPHVDFPQLNSVIDIPNLTNFEIKVNCLARNACDHCIVKFFIDWYEALQVSSTGRKLKKLSIIELQSPLSGEATLSNNQWVNLFLNEYDKLSLIFETVESLTLSLDDYPLIPCTTGSNLQNVARKVIVSDEMRKIRRTMYNRLLDSLNSQIIRELNIPDFLINWLPYTNNSWFDSNGVVDYFHSGQCDKCSQTMKHYDIHKPEDRHMFNDLILKEMFTQAKQKVNPLTSTMNLLSIIGSQKQTNDRFPLRLANNVEITLDDFEKLQKCIFHSSLLRGGLRRLINLEYVNYGGMRLQYKNVDVEKGKVLISSVDWKNEERMVCTLNYGQNMTNG